MEVETQIVPINDILATTVIVTQIQVLFQQLSQAQDLQTLWMIVAIVLFVLTAIVISFSIILGCTCAVKRKAKLTPFPKAIKMIIIDDYESVSINEGILHFIYYLKFHKQNFFFIQ